MTNSPQCKKCIGNVICEPICEPNSGRCISFATLVEEKLKSPNKQSAKFSCLFCGGECVSGLCEDHTKEVIDDQV